MDGSNRRPARRFRSWLQANGPVRWKCEADAARLRRRKRSLVACRTPPSTSARPIWSLACPAPAPSGPPLPSRAPGSLVL
jgi:hypothetical protein